MQPMYEVIHATRPSTEARAGPQWRKTFQVRNLLQTLHLRIKLENSPESSPEVTFIKRRSTISSLTFPDENKAYTFVPSKTCK